MGTLKIIQISNISPKLNRLNLFRYNLEIKNKTKNK